MDGFLDKEAEEVSSDSEVSDSGSTGSRGETKRKKKPKTKKNKRLKIRDSDEEDEEEDEETAKDLEGFINDDEVDQDGDDDDRSKKSESEDELDEDLEDEDYDLLEENLGHKVQRKKKHKRIKMLSDDEEETKEDERDMIAREIFEDEDEDVVERVPAPQPVIRDDRDDDEESDAESDVDDFIVDDEGQPITTGKKKRHVIHDDAALQEAQEMFGVDFDFGDLDDLQDEEEAEEEDEDYEEEEEGERVRTKKTKRKAKKATIYDLFEPSELERSLLTERDQEMRMTDMPERFQLRSMPVTPASKEELEEEAAWIYKKAFCEGPLSRQDNWEGGGGPFSETPRKGPESVGKILDALDFMRNQQFEIPFIAFYRKEYVEPELNINDLWTIYQYDEKWAQLHKRKEKLLHLMENMRDYQFDSIDPDAPLESHVRAITEDDVIRLKSVQSMEEWRDVYEHFHLYYGPEFPKMKAYIHKKKKEERQKQTSRTEEQAEQDLDDDPVILKLASRKTGYQMCVTAGLAELSRRYGLSPEKYAENLRDEYQRHDVEQDPAEPNELAYEFVTNQFQTAEAVLLGARHMVAMQLAHEPLVRQTIREVFYERSYITCKPTKKGLKEIDESHPCYTFRYLKNKPVSDIRNDQFLNLSQASDEGNMEYEIHLDEKDPPRSGQTYFHRIVHLYQRDEFSNLVQEWNKERTMTLKLALEKVLYPHFVKEVKTKLLEEAHEHVIRQCCRKLYSWLKVAPYTVDQQLDVDDEDDSYNGVRILSICFENFKDTASFGALLDADGEVADFIRLPHLSERKHSPWPEERQRKEKDLEKLKDFIHVKKPHVVAVGASCREVDYLANDIKQLIQELESEEGMSPIEVELVDTDLARVFASTKKAETEYREYPTTLRQAVSIGRRLHDALIEFSQLCNQDDDLLSLSFHPLQPFVNKERLLSGLQLEFINRVNEVGVDINRCVTHPHTAPLIQFVCGLGPRKGYNLLRMLKQMNSRLENRTQLVMICRMGPKVFINCAGFIKIDTTALGDSTDQYIEVLDSSRVHPETYEWARKMAVDALEYDDTAADANPTGALEEILENPERLKELDLDAFADELQRLGHGNKHITLYDIRAELNHRYKDLRVPYRPPTAEEKFNMLTKETPATLYMGKLVQCRVSGFAHKRPHGEQLDQANPVRDDDTGLWQCPFCQKNDFPELSEVWNHFDSKACPGQPVGVKVRLDNSLFGFIALSRLSDKRVENPNERVHIGMAIYARITKINIEKFEVELTSKSSDLADEGQKWRPSKDACYDFAQESLDLKKDEDKKKQQRQTYTKRVIAHPNFRNIDYKRCLEEMEPLEQGEVIMRPSSKGADHLTLTWKVVDDILHHVDIKESNKENAFSLGKSLWIGNEEFEDLDEIIARYVQPMAALVRDICKYKYYKPGVGTREVMGPMLYEEKRRAPSKIPYVLSASQEFPGKFLLGYMPRKTPHYEFVTILNEGLKYRQQIFTTLNALVKWFKDHFNDPVPGITTPRPGATPQMTATPITPRTPMGGSRATPQISTFQQLDQNLLQKAAASLTALGLQTPLLTPLVQTPQYQPTPRAKWPGSTPVEHPSQRPRTPMSTPRASVDWAKMAQQWAAQNKKTTHGDTTPLFDE